MNRACILIQTCDKYEHLWEGLQLAYHHNWCWNIGLPIYVLTENKFFTEDVRFKTLNFGFFGKEDQPQRNFSTRMIAALHHLKSIGFKDVMYTQDDFWPLFPVNQRIFEGCLSFLQNEAVDCVHVNEFLPWYNYILSRTEYSIEGIKLRKFEVPSPFHYSHQSAFWKIDSLLEIQNEGEEPYENEVNGTSRVWNLKPNYYFLNYSWYKPEFVNDKGKLLPVAQSYVRDWKWKIEWENKY
jgi:hypothetical protein